MVTNLSAVDAHLRKLIPLGADVRSGAMVYMPLEALNSTSVHCLGAAGYGKTSAMKNWIRHLVRFDQSFTIVEPHKDLVPYALTLLRRSGVRRERIVHINPADEQHSVAFNPFNCGVAASDVAGLVLEAVLKAWGAESFDQTPRLENLLRNTVRLLVDNGLSLLESPDVLDPDNGDLRRALRERVTDPWVREEWIAFEKWPRAERIAIAESTRLRLRRFLESETIRRMLGQSTRTLDLRQLMDDNGILLCDLGNASTPESRRLLGALVINGIFHAAKRRNPRNRREHFVLIDEVGQFATRDLANSLDELRKFGVHFVLAHQRLHQLEREDSDLSNAVMTNAKVKVVFGGLERKECERMAHELYTGDVRGDRVKHVIRQTKFRPVNDWATVETESWSHSDGQTESSSSSESSGENTSASQSVVYGADEDGYVGYGLDDVVNRSDTESSTRNAARSNSSSRSSQCSSTVGGSRSRVPITRHEQFVEESSRQYFSIEEEWEQRIANVARLGKREALVRIFNGPVLHIRTAEVPHVGDEGELERFTKRIASCSPHAATAADAMQEIEARQRRVKNLVSDAEEAERPRAVRSFREPWKR